MLIGSHAAVLPEEAPVRAGIYRSINTDPAEQDGRAGAIGRIDDEYLIEIGLRDLFERGPIQADRFLYSRSASARAVQLFP